jgi:hypothetical protein
MDMNVNTNARPLEASRRLAKGVDLRVKEEAETVVLTSSTRIRDLVPVPKGFMLMSYYFSEIIPTSNATKTLRP